MIGQLAGSADPFVGSWSPVAFRAWIVPLAAAVGLVALWPVVVERVGFRLLLLLSGGASLGWALLLAASRGIDTVWQPLTTGFEYLPLARRVDHLGTFLSTFVERLPSYPTHVRGHPPGPVVALWALAHLGLSDEAIGVVIFAVAALAAPAVMGAVRSFGSESDARRVALVVPLLPAAVWWSSMDAASMGVSACAVAALAASTGSRSTGRRLAGGALAGLLAGAVLVSTYGAVVLLAPLVAVGLVAVRRTRAAAGPLVVAAVAALVPIALLALAGFSWIDGFDATRAEYRAGVGGTRSYGYFLVANLVVLAVVAGPAVLGGAIAGGALRARLVAGWALPAAAAAGALAADLSGYSKGEVERIWLPLVPWLAVAAIGLPQRRVAQRAWLAVQLGTGIAVQLLVASPW